MLISGPTLMLTQRTGKGRAEERSLKEFSNGEMRENLQLSGRTLCAMIR